MIGWAARHPVVSLSLVGIIVCLGAASIVRVPVSYMFGTERGGVYIWFSLPSQIGREALLEKIVRPFERRLSADPGVAHFSCYFSDSSANIGVELKKGEDAKEASERLRRAAAQVALSSPDGTRCGVSRSGGYSASYGLVAQISGVGREAVEKELIPQLRRVAGVKEVRLHPPEAKEVHLRTLGADPAEVQAIGSQIGQIRTRSILGLAAGGRIVTQEGPGSLSELLDRQVAGSGAAGRLGDLVTVAPIERRAGEQLRVNGRDGLFVLVWDDPTATRRTALARARKTMESWVISKGGPGASCKVIMDLWEEVTTALYRLAAGILAGLTICAAAYFLAKRNLWAAAIVSCMIPIALVLAMIIIALFSRGLDIVAMAGLAAGSPLIVWAITLVGERAAGRQAGEAASELLKPLLLGTLVMLAVLLPVSISLDEGFVLCRRAAAVALACSAASVAVATLIFPGLLESLPRSPARLPKPRFLLRSVKSSLRDPVVTTVGALSISVAAICLIGQMLTFSGDGLGDDPRWVNVELTRPEGADAEVFGEACRGVEEKLSQIDGVEWVISFVDPASGRSSLMVNLKVSKTIGKSRGEMLLEIYRALRYESTLRWQLSGEMSGRPEWQGEAETELGHLRMTVRADDPRAVKEAAGRILAASGVKAAQAGGERGLPGQRRLVKLDARVPGVDLAGLLQRSGGIDYTEMVFGGEKVRVFVDDPFSLLGNLPVPLPVWLDSPVRGVPPSSVARFEFVKEDIWPERKDGAFESELVLKVPGKESKLRENKASLYEKLRAAPLPSGATMTLEDLEPRKKLPIWLVPLLLGLFSLWLIAGAGFESLVTPLRILACVAPFLAGGVLSAWLLQVSVGQPAILGFLLLVSLAAGSAAVVEDCYQRRLSAGALGPKAAIQALASRAPGILFAFALIALGLLPIAFSGDPQVGGPMVVVLAGGIAVGAPASIMLLAGMQGSWRPRAKRDEIRWDEGGSNEIVLRSLSKTYRNGVRALADVSARLEPGLVGLLGPNGAGKTTLLRCLVGALKQDRGDVWINGVPRRDDPEGFRSIVGYLPQLQEVPRRMEAGRWLFLWAVEMGLPDPQRRADMALDELGVSDLAGRRLGELSGGQRRRVCIARTLMQGPKMLIVDEPTTGLDPEARVTVRGQLSELALDRLVILSTHIADDVAATCSRLLVLSGGRIIFDGETRQLVEMARGKIRSRLIADEQLKIFQLTHRILSRIRGLDGIEVRYLAFDPQRDVGAPAEPTLEEAYMALVEGV